MMNRASRRSFLKRSAAASAAFAGAGLCASPWLRAAGANDDVRLAVVGVGSRTKIGGQGRNEIRSFRQVPGVRIVALCDVDAVVVTTPNHWHALVTIWARLSGIPRAVCGV